MPKKLIKKCSFCGKQPVFSIKSIYCRTCSHFCARMSNERLSPKVRQDLRKYVRRRGFFCYYTQLELDVFDYESAYFLEFDHVIPHNPKQVVIACSWVNEMKGDMTKSEFRSSIKQLYNYMFKHMKIRKRKFRYWYRLHPPTYKKWQNPSK